MLYQNGLLAGWRVPSHDGEPHASLGGRGVVPPLAEAFRRAQARFGGHLTRPQYVTTWGTLRCPILAPCLAFQSAGNVFLLHPSEGLFGFNPSSRRYAHSVLGSRNRVLQVQRTLGSQDKRLTTVGADRWVVVQRARLKCLGCGQTGTPHTPPPR